MIRIITVSFMLQGDTGLCCSLAGKGVKYRYERYAFSRLYKGGRMTHKSGRQASFATNSIGKYGIGAAMYETCSAFFVLYIY